MTGAAVRDIRTDGSGCPFGAMCLTARQATIISQVAAGLSGQQVARVLGISVRTVYAHTAAARSRAGACSVAELVARCYECGILESGAWPPRVSARCLGIYDADGCGWRCMCGCQR